MGGFLSFDKMITPIIIKVMFWVGVLGSIVLGFAMIGYGIISSSGNFLNVILGLLIFVLGPLVIRIYCEMLIVFFKMQESLIDIRDEIKEEQTSDGSDLLDREVI